MRGSSIVAATISLLGLLGHADAAGQITVLILPIAFADTSGEVGDQSDLHRHRLDLMGAELAASLSADGRQRAELVNQADLDLNCPHSDSTCILALAQRRGAGRLLVAEASKTSTLILNVNARLIDVSTNRRVAARFVSFRGDTDEAWRRTARFLAQQISQAASAPPGGQPQ